MKKEPLFISMQMELFGPNFSEVSVQHNIVALRMKIADIVDGEDPTFSLLNVNAVENLRKKYNVTCERVLDEYDKYIATR